MQAWFARPSMGGALSASFSASPTSPTTAFFFARGCTLTWNVAPPGVSRMEIKRYPSLLALSKLYRAMYQSDC